MTTHRITTTFSQPDEIPQLHTETTGGGIPTYRHMSVELIHIVLQGRLRLKRDGTHAETRFRLAAKRTSPFKSAEASVQSTTGSRDVRISSSNAGNTMFRSSVRSTGFTSPPERHRVPSHFNWTLRP